MSLFQYSSSFYLHTMGFVLLVFCRTDMDYQFDISDGVKIFLMVGPMMDTTCQMQHAPGVGKIVPGVVSV